MERLDIPLKNMLHDYTSYETSEKIKKSLRIEKENGNFVGSSALYGYKKDSNDIHKLVIDKDAASIVKSVFDMYLLGSNKTEIANELNKNKVLTPSAYKNTNGLGYTKVKKDNKWNYEIIDRILRDENYTGTLVQGRRRNENYKTHKEVKVPERNWIKYENHHEAIIDKKDFFKVQENLKIQRRTTNKKDILLGYLKCVDCDGTMILIKGKNKDYYYYRNSISKKICSKHRIEKDYLFNVIIEKINSKNLIKDKIKELDKDIIMKLIDTIYIYEDNKIKIIFKKML